MQILTSPFIIFLRNIGRKLGLNNLIARLFFPKGYETKYEDKFLNGILPGDCVWDIGANLGQYTKKFSNKVGDLGFVCAFEPSLINFEHLKENCRLLKNTDLFSFGLSDANKKLGFLQGEDSWGSNSQIVESKNGRDEIEVRKGSDLIENNIVKSPNVLKIDVEGHELEVINGLNNYLSEPSLRLIGIEVHFEILKEKGMVSAPAMIQKILEEKGLYVEWSDPSHIVAFRNT